MKKILFLFVFFFISSILFSFKVNIILKDKTIINGEFIREKENFIIIKKNNKAEEIKKEDILAIYKTDTNEQINIKNTKKESDKKSIDNNKFIFFALGEIGFGTIQFLPCQPVEGDSSTYQFAGVRQSGEYDLSYAYGFSIEYLLDKLISLIFDGGISTWQKLIAKENTDAYGGWVYEETNYTTAIIDGSIFPFDVYYYMDTVFFRLGVKFQYDLTKNINLFTGILGGFYSWQATIGSKEAQKKFRQDTGIALGYGIIMGIDFNINDFIIRIYSDLGSPVTQVEFNDLFYNGWDFYSSSEFVVAPYKIGIGLGYPF